MPQKYKDFKREESDILLSSKKSDLGKQSHGQGIHNNFMMMSEKSYTNDEINFMQTELRDHEEDLMQERTIDS